jgi:hypothetical protein
VDADESLGLADPVALDRVLQDGGRLLRRQTRVKQGRALAFGKAGLAGLAVKQAGLLEFAVAVADREISGVTPAVERAMGILAAEA